MTDCLFRLWARARAGVVAYGRLLLVPVLLLVSGVVVGLLLITVASGATAFLAGPYRRYDQLVDSELTVPVSTLLLGGPQGTVDDLADLPDIDGKSALEFLRAAGAHGMPEAAIRLAEERKRESIERNKEGVARRTQQSCTEATTGAEEARAGRAKVLAATPQRPPRAPALVACEED